MAFLLKDCLQFSALAAKDQNNTVARGKPAFRVVPEARGDLHRECCSAFEVAVLDVAIAWRVVEFHQPNRRDNYFASRVGNEGSLHCRDDFRRTNHLLDLRTCIDLCHHSSSRTLGDRFPPQMTTATVFPA